MPSSALDDIRRTLAQRADEAVTLPDFMVVLRFLGTMSLIGAALAAYMWSRMEVTRIAVALDETRSDLARAEILHGRLVLERSMLRQPDRLSGDARSRGMVAPEQYTDLRQDARPRNP